MRTVKLAAFAALAISCLFGGIAHAENFPVLACRTVTNSSGMSWGVITEKTPLGPMEATMRKTCAQAGYGHLEKNPEVAKKATPAPEEPKKLGGRPDVSAAKKAVGRVEYCQEGKVRVLTFALGDVLLDQLIPEKSCIFDSQKTVNLASRQTQALQPAPPRAHAAVPNGGPALRDLE